MSVKEAASTPSSVAYGIQVDAKLRDCFGSGVLGRENTSVSRSKQIMIKRRRTGQHEYRDVVSIYRHIINAASGAS